MALDEFDEQADGLSDDDGPGADVGEMESFFAEDFDDDAPDVLAETDVDSDDDTDQDAPQRQSGPKSWKSMTDDEIRQADPGEIRSTIAGLQRLTTQDRQETRDLQRQLIQLQAQQAQMLRELQNGVAQRQPEQSDVSPQRLEDVMDDPQALAKFVQQTVQDAIRQQVDPIRQTVDQTSRDAVVAKLERQFAALQKAVPHFRDPAIQGKVIQKMEDTGGTLTPQEAYRLLYPREYLEAQQRALTARSKPTNEPQKAAATPPGRRTQSNKTVAGLVGDELIDAMASELEKSGDLRKVAPPARLPR